MNCGTDTGLEAVVKRSEYLEEIIDGKRRRDELGEALDKSGSTVYKQLRDLEEAGVVKRTSDGYTLTELGRAVCLKVDDVARTFESAELFEKVDVPPEILAEGEFYPGDEKAPDEPVLRMEADAEDADEVRGLTPVVFDRYVENTHRLVTEEGVEAEFVVERTVVEHVKENRHGYFESAVESDAEFYVTDEELPYGLILVDEVLSGVVVYGEKGSTLGYVRFDSPEAHDWFEEVYKKHRHEAETI
ncbi:MAG: hypothetical protein U5J64_12290 [Halobacteriales archaeon]|nr:hypothetical protein [Halobacteriales archaeon]